MSQTVIYTNLVDVQQVLRYNEPARDTSGNPGFYLVAVITNMKTQGSDGSLRDVQTITNYGAFNTTAYTPQQIYTTINAAQAGHDLALELKNAFNQATATIVV